jgi:DNA-binding SARP family transcriptional activator
MWNLNGLLLAVVEDPSLCQAFEWAGLPQLRQALEVLAESQSRHEHAGRAMQEVSGDFQRFDAERQARLLHLQHLLAAAANMPRLPADSPDLRVVATRQPAHAELPPLEITCLGGFEVRRENRPVQLCSNRNGQAILRFLVTQPRHRASMDILMETFWPQDEREAARHKLHCAFSALRRSLNDGYTERKGVGYLLCRNGMYELNSSVEIRIDIDEFVARYRGGRQAGGSAAVVHYQAACTLYKGPLLPEDLYADWSQLHREQLEKTYLLMCDALATHHLAAERPGEAVEWASRIIAMRPCDEAAFQQLMRASAAEGRRDEVVRQYRRCELMLREELGVQPSDETIALLQAILSGDLQAAGPAEVAS